MCNRGLQLIVTMNYRNKTVIITLTFTNKNSQTLPVTKIRVIEVLNDSKDYSSRTTSTMLMLRRLA